MLEMREQKCAAGVLEMIEMNDCGRQELEDKGNKIEEQAESILEAQRATPSFLCPCGRHAAGNGPETS